MTVTSKTYGVDMTRRIEAYLAVKRPALEAYLTEASQSAPEAYEAVERPALEAYLAASQSAWEALACGNPLVDWIVANCAAHKSKALMILRVLPAPLDALDVIAESEEWCGAWEALRDEAIRAGVISQ